MHAVTALLDSRTMAILITIVYLALACIMVHTYLTRKTYPGFGYWTASIASWALGVVFNFNYSVLGGPYGLMVSHVLTMSGLPLMYHGFALYCGLDRLRLRAAINVALVAVGLALMAYYLLARPDYSVRATVFSLINAIFFLRAAVEPYLSRRAVIYPAQHMVAVIFIIFAVLMSLRAYDNFFVHSYDNVHQDPLLKIVLLVAAVTTVFLVFAMLNMTSSRIEAELREARERMQAIADTDSLTGLSTRRRFMELAEHAVKASQRYGRPVSLLLLDIDHFKMINDTLGHAAGDAALTQAGGLLAKAVREVDVAGRLGGEEFGLLLPETGEVKAGQVAERIRLGMEELLPLGQKVTVSIGVAELGQEGLDALMVRADRALYAAKEAGRNQVRVSGKT